MGAPLPYLPRVDFIKLYDEYMASKEWQAKKKARKQLDNYTCQICGATSELEVHHKTPAAYQRLGREDVEHDLITLCHTCHVAVHLANKKRRNRK